MKVESSYSFESQTRLRADVSKVTRHDLAGELVDNCFDDIQKAVWLLVVQMLRTALKLLMAPQMYEVIFPHCLDIFFA